MKYEGLETFMYSLDDMQFISLDDFFIKKKKIKEKFDKMSYFEREIYKWYFFYQLCLVKWKSKDGKYIKESFWSYLCDRENDNEINRLYLEFCIFRDNQYKKTVI